MLNLPLKEVDSQGGWTRSQQWCTVSMHCCFTLKFNHMEFLGRPSPHLLAMSCFSVSTKPVVPARTHSRLSSSLTNSSNTHLNYDPGKLFLPSWSCANDHKYHALSLKLCYMVYLTGHLDLDEEGWKSCVMAILFLYLLCVQVYVYVHITTHLYVFMVSVPGFCKEKKQLTLV